MATIKFPSELPEATSVSGSDKLMIGKNGEGMPRSLPVSKLAEGVVELSGLPSSEELASSLSDKVDKEDGKQLSTNDYTDTDKAKVAVISVDPAGDENKFLNEKGEYKEVVAPVQGVNVNGEEVLPDENGIITVEIPKAPVQSVSVNGEDVQPDQNGNVNVEIPDAPVQSISVNGEDVTPDEDGNVNVEIPNEGVQGVVYNGNLLDKDSEGNVTINVNETVEQTLDPNSTNPVSSAAVAAEFDQLGQKYGAALALNSSGDEGAKVYSLSLLDENGNIISTTEEFSGGGGGEVSTTRIQLTKLTENTTVKAGDEVDLTFQYDHVDTATESSTGLPGQATITIISGASSTTKELTLSAGSINTIKVGEELAVGSNTIRVRVAVDNGETTQVSTLSWTIQVVNLVLTSNYDLARATAKGSIINVPFALNGAGNKSLRCYVNGVEFETRSITASSGTGSFSIPTSSLSHGNVSVQLVAELETNNGLIIKSNSIYYDLIVTETGNSSPVVAARFNYQDGTIIEQGQRPYLSTRQLDNFIIQYAAYHPLQANKLVEIVYNGSVINSANVGFTTQRFNYRSVVSGTFPATIRVGELDYDFDVVVSEADVDLQEPSDNMVYKFTAQGKSNSDVGRNVWQSTVGDITATLTSVKFGGDGWNGRSLRLTDDGRLTINHNTLSASNALVANSWTFQVKFSNSEVSDEEAQVIKCLDSAGTGFVITPTEAKMITRGNAEVVMKLAYGEVYNVMFVCYPTFQEGGSEDERINSNILFLYINGIISGIVQRGSGDTIYQASPTNVVFGANGATTDIYSIRHYTRYLNDSQALDLYLVDQDDTDDIIEQYNANAIIDGNGNITVDSLADDMRYIIVTGVQPNGVPTLLEAAVQNDKDPKYNVDEIIHIKRSEPSLNFKLTGGCIRLQGTSSLAYPIKNYRIYTSNANKEPGQLYIGVDAQGNGGTLADEPLLSFKVTAESGKIPAPVDLWCLKADYAESSSSHNTGMARLLDNTLRAIGDLTPAQKYVSSSYQYDVRTTVDGEPCYLFYRATTSDAPIFLGKYNMNNDKATEAVFGFLDIPGYHDAQWVQDKFGGENPTECWETLNNDTQMGVYLDDDFDALDENGNPNWTNTFEARFPDNQDDYMDGTKKPTLLQNMVSWVKSTLNDKAKFKSELADYFDVPYLCDYFVFTKMFGAVDQMVKNTMIGFWYNPDKDKVLGYYIFYDGDTINGVRNDGRLKYHWDLNRQTIDPESGEYAYMGHDSVLWNNLESEFAEEIGAAYRRMRTYMTNDRIFNMFNREQSDKFVARTYNIDAMNKYVKPATVGVDVVVGGVEDTIKYDFLESAQGSRKSHRQWWLTNRLSLLDAEYSTGQYTLTDITWKGVSAAGAKIKATTSRDFFLEFRREGNTFAHDATQAGVEWVYTYNDVANIGTIFHLLGGAFISHLNMSEWGGFADLTLPTLPLLEELILGRSGQTYTLGSIAIANKLPMLRSLDITNYTDMASIDLSLCGRLEELKARGCTTLSIVNLAAGAPIQSLILPQNMRTLKLDNFTKLSNSGISFPDGNSVQSLIVESCPIINWEALISSLGNVQNIRITGIDMDVTVSWLEQYKGFGGVDASGSIVPNARLVGEVRLLNSLTDAQLQEYTAKFPELNIVEPEFTMIEFDDNVADDANVSNLDNNTGYKFGNNYQPSGHINRILAARYRCLGKVVEEGSALIYPLHNDNSHFYADTTNVTNASPAALDGTEGDAFMYEPAYYYKGVNDYLNGKKYALFASGNVEPSKPDPSLYKKLTLEDIADLGGYSSSQRVNTGKATISESIVSDSTYDVVSVNVSGYSRVRFPSVVGTALVGAVFSDANGNILKNVIVQALNSKFENGMYVITNIPANAQKLHFTVAKTADFDFVLLSNSNKIEDMEPDWVYHEPCLTAMFEATSIGSDVRSAISGEDPIDNITITDIGNYAEQRYLQLVDYEMSKDVANLFFARYGRRDSQGQCGYGANSSTRIVGSTADLGMKDTVNPTNATTGAWYVDKNEFGEDVLVPISNVNVMGYENWHGNKAEWMQGITYPNSNNNELYKARIVMPNGSVRMVKTSTGTTFRAGNSHGKYMDTLAAGTMEGSSSTYYCDYFGSSGAANRVFYRSVSGANANGGVSYASGPHDASSSFTYIGSRLAFRGQIVKAQSVANFKNAIPLAW